MIRTVWMHVLVQSFLSPDEPTGYARCFNAMQTLYLTLQLAKQMAVRCYLYLSFSFTCQVKTFYMLVPKYQRERGKAAKC